MKTKILLVFETFVLITCTYGQTFDLTFTAVNNTTYVHLDSVKVMNRSQMVDSVIHWPDTTFTVTINPGDLLLFAGYSTGFPIGIQEINTVKEQFQLLQSHPNPVEDQSIIPMYVPKKGTVNVMVSDVQGRLLFTFVRTLDKGYHRFRFTPGNSNIYIATALWNGESRSIKILSMKHGNGKSCLIEYIGSSDNEASLKILENTAGMIVLESGILDTPVANETYTFEFATNIPCPGTPTVTYEGQVYNTIQIFSQCWLKENLNVGIMINGTQDQTNNSITEKYCYENNPDSCTKYGGLYQWNEMMQYTTQRGTQGICPPGWHLPTDEEWKVLEGAVDSQYGIGDLEWDIDGYRGFDAGGNLKTASGWYNNGNGTDLFGFSGLPGGIRYYDGYFDTIGSHGTWWASTESYGDFAWYRNLYCTITEVYRLDLGEEEGFSVRCVRDY